MAGYSDTKKLIEDTLVGRPEGSLIYPYQHQRFALSMLDYIHSVELMGVSDLQGIATTDTVPVEPENAKVAYIATVPPSQTYVYTNFLDEDGDPITVTTGANTVSLLTLLWNGTYWQVQNSPVQLAVDYSDGFLLKDVISTDVNPGTPDLNMFYIALPGTYTHFTVAPITVKQGQLGIFTYENSAWSSEVFTIANWSVVNVNDINGSAAAYGSAQAARAAVPLQYKKCGLQITYLLSTGWMTDQYIGPDESASTPTPWPNWSTASNWQVLGPVTVSQNTETNSDGNGTINIGGTDVGKYAGADKLIKLVGFATSQAAFQDGDVYYNTSSKELRKRIDANNYVVVPFYDGSIYTYNSNLYVWDGSDLRSVCIISKDGTTKNLKLSIGNDVTLIPSLDNIDDLQNSVYGSKNLLDISKSSNGLLNQDGTQGSQAYYRTSGLIRVQAGQKITRSGTGINALMEYDLNGNPITSTYTTSNPTTYTQVNDGYVRVSYPTANEGTAQIEYGDTATSYSPYKLELNSNIKLSDVHLSDIETFMGGKTSDLAKIVTEKEGLPITTDITSNVSFANGFYYNENGQKVESGSYKCGRIEVSPYDILKITASVNARYIVIFDANGNVLIAGQYGNSAYCPENSSYIWVTYAVDATITKIEKTSKAIINNALELTYSTNLFDTSNFTEGGYINPSTGAVSAESTLGYTDYIPVEEGKVLICGDGINITRYMRFIAAYDKYKGLMSSAGSTDGTTGYTVPEDVAYVRVSISLSNLHEDSRINLIKSTGKLLRYEPFNVKLMPKGTADNRELRYNILNSPLTTFPNLLKSVSYKPLGQLSKPYICFSTDDGYSQLATKTIPLFVSENVPITAYVMKGSPVFNSAENIQTIKNAIESGHCEIGQHGYTPFTQYNEDQLNAYLDNEKAYFDTLEIELKGSSTPTGAYNDMVNAVCGGRFGTNRNLDGAIKYGGEGEFANGPKSNIYALTTLGLKGHSLETNKLYIDYAFENNWLMMPYFHDFDFDDTAEGQAFYEMVQELIQYAKTKGMTFITASQIPDII